MDEGVRASALQRGRLETAERVTRLRLTGWRVVQCAVGAATSLFVAQSLLGHDTPFLAAIAAVIGIGTAQGRRLRRVAEVVGGVAVGILVGDLLVAWIGTGLWQLALVVTLAMSVAVLASDSALVSTQAAVNGIIVVTLLPNPEQGLSRWMDAVVGGAVAVLVVALSPVTPYRAGREQASTVCAFVARDLRWCAVAARDGEPWHAEEALASIRRTQPSIDQLRAAVTEGEEVVKVSPLRWRHRVEVQRYVALVTPLDRAVRNLRVLVRRVLIGLQRHEPGMDRQAALLDDLADALDLLAAELRTGALPVRARGRLLAIGAATARPEVLGGGLSAQVVLAQLRSTVVDLLQVSGLPLGEAIAAVPEVPVDGDDR